MNVKIQQRELNDKKPIFCQKFSDFYSSVVLKSVGLDETDSPPFVVESSFRFIGVGNEAGIASVYLTEALSERTEALTFSNAKMDVNGRLVGQSKQAHDNAIYDLNFNKDSTILLTTSPECRSRAFDLSSMTEFLVFSHSSIPKSIKFNPFNERQIVIGTRKELLMYDIRTSNIISKHKNFHQKSTITAALFISEYGVVSSGSNDGTLKFFDTRYLRGPNSEVDLEQNVGITSLALSVDRMLYAQCSNNNIVQICSQTGFLERLYRTNDFNVDGFYGKLGVSPCGKYIGSGSKNGSAFLWETSGSQAWELSGHRASCVGVSFGSDHLVTCSDDMTVRYWDHKTVEDYTGTQGYTKKLDDYIPEWCKTTEALKDKPLKNKKQQALDDWLQQRMDLCDLPDNDKENSTAQISDRRQSGQSSKYCGATSEVAPKKRKSKSGGPSILKYFKPK